MMQKSISCINMVFPTLNKKELQPATKFILLGTEKRNRTLVDMDDITNAQFFNIIQ